MTLMTNNKNLRSALLLRLLFSILLGVFISACGSSAATRQAEIDARLTGEGASNAMTQATLQAEQERQSVAHRLQAERDALEQRRQQDTETSARIAAAEQAAEQAAAQRAQVEAGQQRQRLLAQQQRERQAQTERSTLLEREIEDSRQQTQTQALANEKLAEVIIVAEELLQMLNSEQAKYGDLDDQGMPRDPLRKSLIIELEARKNSLIQEARTRAQ